MKSTEQKRKEAMARATMYVYDNSKAKRLSTASEESWNKARMIHQLEIM